MKNKIKIFIFIVLCLIVSPSIILAYDVDSQNVCQNCGSQSYYTNKYQSNGSFTRRDPDNIHGYTTTVNGSTQRLFCLEPDTSHANSGYSRNNKIDEVLDKAGSSSQRNKWIDGLEKYEDDLNKVLSCWNTGRNSIAATQAIVWELVAEERAGINANQILNGNYIPYMSNGSRFMAGSQIADVMCPNGINNATSSGTCGEYQAVLRCAARFDVTPSFAYSTDLRARSNPLQLTNYDDETQTFSRTFRHTGLDSSLLKYYQISAASGLTITKTNNSITISTTNEILESNAVKVTLNYALKENGYELNDDPTYFYYKSDSQILMQGSAAKPAYMYVYTGKRPTYQLRVQKKDEDGNVMSGVKFNVYSNSSLTDKIGTTTATGSDGWAYLKGIKKVGKYYIQEADTPDGYITNKEVVTVNVTGSNREGSNSYATASQTFVNKYMHLKLSKQTINSEGEVIDVEDYTGNNCTGDYIGPVFTLSKDGKDIYVKQNSAGNYIVSSESASGSTNEIRTCNGKFDIEKIESGTYEITEIEAPNGYTLPENPTQTVTVTKGQDATAMVMYNGVTGVVFNKISENGELIDGGKYALQQRVNGVYRDMLLKKEEGVSYSYVEDLTEEDDGATYILETTNGTINVKNLPPGEYRFVEKQAPEGYDIIKDKDSNATFTISDKGIFGEDGQPVTDYYQVRLVNQKTRVSGSYDQAELIVTIITGRKVINYALIVGGLVVILILLIVLRKKFKK